MALSTAGAFLACVSRVNFHHGNTAQGGLVADELEKLREGPLISIRVGTNLGTFGGHVLQFLNRNGTAMCCGVVHDLLGHDMILVCGAPRVITLELRQEASLALPLQILFPISPALFCARGVESQMAHFPGLRISHNRHVPHTVAIHAYHPGKLSRAGFCGVVTNRAEPLRPALKKLRLAHIARNRIWKSHRNNHLPKECRNANSFPFEFDLLSFVATDRQAKTFNTLTFLVAGVFSKQTLGEHTWNFRVVFAARLVTVPQHPFDNWD